MLVFPVDTDRRLSRTPWVNYALVLTNVVVFFLTMYKIDAYNQALLSPNIGQLSAQSIQSVFPITQYFLWPNDPQIKQFITHQFLHMGWLHLFGNMVFLFVFGNSVEDRLGKIGYLCLYLAGGIVAGLLHSLLEASPVLGASGAVAAVTAAYLVLFPLTYVRLFAWVTEFEVSSLVVIVYYIFQDILFNQLNIYRTAYLAHVGGYVFGFVSITGLLLTGILPREPYDLVQWLKHKHRRMVFKRLSRKPIWDHVAEKTKRKGSSPPAVDQPTKHQAIQDALANGQVPLAAKRYIALLSEDAEAHFDTEDQLTLANQLMENAAYPSAAQAYELFLKHHPGYEQRASIQLILGLLYARYLQSPDRARDLLTQALPYLDADNAAHCEKVLADLPS